MEKSIKTLVFLFSLLFLYTIVLAEVKVPSEIKFNKEVYKQVYQAGNGKTSYKVKEYLKSGETLEKFLDPAKKRIRLADLIDDIMDDLILQLGDEILQIVVMQVERRFIDHGGLSQFFDGDLIDLLFFSQGDERLADVFLGPADTQIHGDTSESVEVRLRNDQSVNYLTIAVNWSWQ